MIYKQKKTSHVLLAFAIIITIALIVCNFISSPMRISTYSLIFPREKWLLTLGGGGQIISNVIDYSEGHTTQYDISQFERGEFVSVNFTNILKGKKEFVKGDTIVSMKSSNIQDQLVNAEGELQIAIANLKSQNSAQKEPLIKEAESRKKYTEEKIAEQKVLFNRTQKLFEKGYSSKQEYELQKWNLDLLEIELKTYIAQIENLTTGVKQEEIQLLQSQISAIKSRLEFLRQRENQLLVLAPISGVSVNSVSPDTLLHVVNSKQLILQMPIKINDLAEFKVGQTIPISFSGIDYSLYGTVASIDKEVKFISRQQVVYVSILIENTSNRFLPGMVVENSIELRSITLLEQITRIFTQ